jgi:hypothetical protein
MVRMLAIAAAAWASAASAVSLEPSEAALVGGATPSPGSVVDDAFRAIEIHDDESPETVLATGAIEAQIIDEDGTGRERYEYRITNDPGSAAAITTASFTDFAGYAVDADFRADVAGAAPGAVSRSLNGSYVTFSFAGDAIAPGASSRWLFVQTDAFASGAFGSVRLQVGSDTEDFAGFFTPVPEPDAAASALAALATAAALARRRFQTG